MKEPVRHYYNVDSPEHTACGIILDRDNPMYLYVDKVTCKRCMRTDNFLLGAYEETRLDHEC